VPKLSPETATLQAHPPTSPCAEAEPISKGHCRNWHHKMEVSCLIYPATSGERLMH